MKSTEISLGQTAWHSDWLEQLPKPSWSIWRDHLTDSVFGFDFSLGQLRQMRHFGRDKEHRGGVLAGRHARAAADALRRVHRTVRVGFGDRGVFASGVPPC